MHLGLVQHGESTDPPSVLQGVQRCTGGVVVCLTWVSLLLLGGTLPGMLVQSMPGMVLPLATVGISDKAFSSPLHLVQQGEVALGTAHSGEWAVLHDGHHLCLVQLHEAIRVE